MGPVEDDFDGPGLDLSVWVPHYLPAWSSRAASRATYAVRDSALHLTIPHDHPVWCPDEHRPPMRVSGVQSGNFSGPVGSTVGQQPFLDGQTVKEEQPELWGWTPRFGTVEVRMRGLVTPRSMFAAWLVGLETVPEQSAEICIAEIFGDAVVPGGSAAVGMGLHSFRDARVPEDFEAVRLPIDVREAHDYAVAWTPDSVELSVDGRTVRRCGPPPSYPMQLMLAVFDFPERAGDDDHDTDRDAVPEMVVERVRGYPS
jgi:Glycosyl hydrolases family 16